MQKTEPGKLRLQFASSNTLVKVWRRWKPTFHQFRGFSFWQKCVTQPGTPASHSDRLHGEVWKLGYIFHTNALFSFKHCTESDRSYTHLYPCCVEITKNTENIELLLTTPLLKWKFVQTINRIEISIAKTCTHYPLPSLWQRAFHSTSQCVQ